MGAKEMIFQAGEEDVPCRCTIILEATGYDVDVAKSKSNDST